MDNGVDKSTIQQTQAAKTEIGINTCAVRTVAIHQQRVVSFAKMFAMIDQRNRNFDAITGDYPQVFTAVIRRIKTRNIKGNANDFPGLAVNLPQTG